MNKGDRVRVVRGRKSMGVDGTVFWEGPNKYGEGTRLGLKDADGETHWVPSENVELLDTKQGEDPAPKTTGGAPDESQLTKGARVRWRDDKGVIFWVGQNKFGPGLRLGVTGADEQKHWLDAAEVQLVVEEEAQHAGAVDDQEYDWADREDDRDFGDDSDDGEVPL